MSWASQSVVALRSASRTLLQLRQGWRSLTASVVADVCFFGRRVNRVGGWVSVLGVSGQGVPPLGRGTG